MCTVTYIPNTNQEFYITSNRDEAPFRAAQELVIQNFGSRKVLYPRDDFSKGSWIAASNQNQLVCILNGAFDKHRHLPPYRLSRGIMALDFFRFESTLDFFNAYSFEGIEPFTMVIFDDGKLYDFKWDEKEKHILDLPLIEKHIWSSCTLYSKEWQEKRKTWFAAWQKENGLVNKESILSFHKTAGVGDKEYDLVMNRENMVRTTSITSVFKNQNGFEVELENLLHKTTLSKSIEFSTIGKH